MTAPAIEIESVEALDFTPPCYDADCPAEATWLLTTCRRCRVVTLTCADHLAAIHAIVDEFPVVDCTRCKSSHRPGVMVIVSEVAL